MSSVHEIPAQVIGRALEDAMRGHHQAVCWAKARNTWWNPKKTKSRKVKKRIKQAVEGHVPRLIASRSRGLRRMRQAMRELDAQQKKKPYRPPQVQSGRPPDSRRPSE